MTSQTDDRFIKETIAKGSKSFARAARLFDPATRRSAMELYAWCRHCDDVIDGQTLGHGAKAMDTAERERRLAYLTEQTHRALNGEAVAEPAFRALQRVALRHDIPKRYPLELIEGFAMDVAGRQYQSLQDVLLYGYHVAGVVGVMMAHLMGMRDAATLQRAADLGIAFQLTNICRDVTDDAAAGRLYVPRDWLAEAGVAPECVGEAAHRDAVFALARRLLAEAEPYYASARIGVRQLPYRSAWAIATAQAVYRDIGRALLAAGPEGWDARVSTGRGRKLLRVGQGAFVAAFARMAQRRPEPPRPALWRKEAV